MRTTLWLLAGLTAASIHPAYAQLFPSNGLLSIPFSIRNTIQPPGTGVLQIPQDLRQQIEPPGTGAIGIPAHVMGTLGQTADTLLHGSPPVPQATGGGQSLTSANPVYAIPPSNVANLMAQPARAMDPLQTLDGQPYAFGARLGPNTPLRANACWSVQAQPPFSTPPDHFDGQLILPSGAAWTPGSWLDPTAVVYAWMCANWKWGFDQTP